MEEKPNEEQRYDRTTERLMALLGICYLVQIGMLAAGLYEVFWGF